MPLYGAGRFIAHSSEAVCSIGWAMREFVFLKVAAYVPRKHFRSLNLFVFQSVLLNGCVDSSVQQRIILSDTLKCRDNLSDFLVIGVATQLILLLAAVVFRDCFQ